jgi:trafficking protein particle complex subunit 10
MMNVHEEALVQYDELEAAYFQNLLEQGAPWFQTFGGLDLKDDSHNILDISGKAYRDMILQNTITIFDFRIYLFARQIQILSRLSGSVNNICQRSKVFISSFCRTLKEYKVQSKPYIRFL